MKVKEAIRNEHYNKKYKRRLWQKKVQINQINLGPNNKKHKEDVASNRYPTNEFLESLSGLIDDKVIDIGL